jgi:hypothetical protein
MISANDVNHWLLQPFTLNYNDTESFQSEVTINIIDIIYNDNQYVSSEHNIENK